VPQIHDYIPIPVSSAATLILTASATATSCVITNNGASPVFIGGSAVTPTSGFPLMAGQTISVPFVNQNIYACANVNNITTPTDTLSAPASAAATALTVASGGASFTNGMVISINDGVNTELVTVGSGSTGTSVVVSATAHAHATGTTFGQFQSTNGSGVSVTTNP
jgi:hypothetical protein